MVQGEIRTHHFLLSFYQQHTKINLIKTYKTCLEGRLITDKVNDADMQLMIYQYRWLTYGLTPRELIQLRNVFSSLDSPENTYIYTYIYRKWTRYTPSRSLLALIVSLLTPNWLKQ